MEISKLKVGDIVKVTDEEPDRVYLVGYVGEVVNIMYSDYSDHTHIVRMNDGVACFIEKNLTLAPEEEAFLWKLCNA